MKILYVSQYFPPEIGATQTRAFEMAKGLVRAGHEVTVLTEVPNHPRGVIAEAYRGKLFVREELDGIEVIRVWVKASTRKDFRSRLIFYLSFMFMAMLAGLTMARGRYDVLYVSSPPLFVGGTGLFLSYLRRIPLVFEVRDLWPQAAVDLGQLNDGLALSLATWLEESCYRRARRIVVVTNGLRDALVARDVPAEKLAIITNGANTEIYRPLTAGSSLRRRLGLMRDHFVIGFTGLHGLAHGLETVLHCARLLREQSDIRFLLVGDGPVKEALVQQAREFDLTNIIFHPAVPELELPEYIGLLDIGLHTSRRVSVSAGTLPVKMFSYLACEKPVLLAIEGEAADLVRQAGVGLVVPPEEPEALAQAILRMRAGEVDRVAMGQRGRALVTARFSRQALARQLESVLQEVTVGA
ncbi:MAG: glycosyltransferase family 4 protein [Candidatus Promineifilaceae bacterium]|nr:glycosyltransferase family 4 protein [Candidatus Promineifilaceae bacterium]